MNFLELVKNRQSDRAYIPQPIEKEKIERCLEAARLAPSACNAQPWKFIVVDNPEIKNAVADATSNRILPINHFTKQAPVHVVVVMEKPNFTSKFGSTVKDKPFPLIDIGIATENFCLQAVEEGLGTCIIGWFNEEKVKKLLNIPNNLRAMLIILMGYRSTELRTKKRKSLDEIRSYNTYK